MKADSPAAEENILTKPAVEAETEAMEKEKAAEEAVAIEKMIAESVSNFSDPEESDFL